jgi:hypothetical protein
VLIIILSTHLYQQVINWDRGLAMHNPLPIPSSHRFYCIKKIHINSHKYRSYFVCSMVLYVRVSKRAPWFFLGSFSFSFLPVYKLKPGCATGTSIATCYCASETKVQWLLAASRFHDESLVLLSLLQESQESTNKFTSLFGPRNVRKNVGPRCFGYR